MPTLPTNAPIVGTDNISPIYNPLGRWQIWNINEIYLGTIGSNKYVPKVNDVVYEVSGRSIVQYIVHSIDPVTFIAELIQQDTTNQTQPFSADDILFGVGPGTQSDTYRVYIDKSVTPYRLSVDRRLFVGGSTCQYCKLFKGANTSNSGIVISGTYDQNGILVSENLPLQTVATTTLNNSAIKVVATGFTRSDLLDGELVTAVLYDSNGFVISKRQLLVENTGFIRGTDSQKKYVSSIALETPFLSTVNNKLIQYPINVPLNSMNLIGIVNYSDGSFTRIAVDGNKFSIFGLDAYSATAVGQTSDLVLKYKLDQNEEALNVHIGSDTFISETYQIVTVTSNGHYAVRAYPYPVWVDDITGYSLKWYIYDLDRTISYEVTPNVLIANSTFNPTLYGVKQTLNISINLRTINGNYNNFNHVQSVDITLNKPGTGRPIMDEIPNWLVNSLSGSGNIYGTNVYSTYERNTQTEWLLRIAPKFITQMEWLDAIYKDTNPMFDSNLELGPLDPTHFIVTINSINFEFPISQWNQKLSINQPITNNSTIVIKFIRRSVQRDLQLSIASTLVFQVDSNNNFI
jgi:hypothetical protein